jgi:hypothetical protein
MSRALRRHQAQAHMMRRLKAHNNQHYDDPREMARFREQPQVCSCENCGNVRRRAKGAEKLTMQERR